MKTSPMSKATLESYKKDLLTRRENLARELRQATAELINDESSYTDAIDQASADTDKSLALVMKNRDRNVLSQIDEVLRRMEGGSFGKCERCGEPISEARLRAFPFTTLCIDCKAEVESEQGFRVSGRV